MPTAELTRLQAALQRAGATWTAGETSISGLSAEARAKLMSPRPAGPFPPGKPLPRPLSSPPAAYDWSYLNGKNYVTAPKMQDGGTCTAYASTAAMESCAIRSAEADATIDFAEHAIIESPDGCCGNLHGIAAFIQNTGLPPRRGSRAASQKPNRVGRTKPIRSAIGPATTRTPLTRSKLF